MTDTKPDQPTWLVVDDMHEYVTYLLHRLPDPQTHDAGSNGDRLQAARQLFGESVQIQGWFDSPGIVLTFNHFGGVLDGYPDYELDSVIVIAGSGGPYRKDSARRHAEWVTAWEARAAAIDMEFRAVNDDGGETESPAWLNALWDTFKLSY